MYIVHVSYCKSEGGLYAILVEFVSTMIGLISRCALAYEMLPM